MKPVLPLLLAALSRREMPQELSHDRYVRSVKEMLDLNNTISCADPTFGLLANNQAIAGMGTVTDPNCLQLTIADIALTNAKATRNTSGMVASLIYRALERNTAAVGVVSEKCTSYTPRNSELLAFQQHQDPASPGAEANNKAVVLELARQILGIGGDPTDALKSGTFQPGDPNSSDPTGNSCDTADCIFSNDALVNDASEAEIYDYVAKCAATVTSTIGPGESVPTGGSIPVNPSNSQTRTSNTPTNSDRFTTTSGSISLGTASVQPTQTTQTTTTRQQQQQTTTPTSTTTSTPAISTTTNYQTFSQAYLGVFAPAVTQDSNGMYHAGTDPNNVFNNLKAALGRSCDIQKNDCANTANSQKQPVGPCDTQNTQCKAETGGS
ncbi:hypothetical protein M408DRAFT_329285 [Serendipita vermifera MAFF 305830]|uniref:Uncharacterized protein n=1 Tax=Serendipita vermifera MAFF 305830 TaxID=933852 RepID=A0A0C2XID9_SERVB|nr:hypothetical protein M408DRAFT_329285 [Serendipita vermifera MAFF 305830]